MADNVAITAGSGTTVATDQIPGTLEHIQIVKIADGTADSATRIAGSANGLRVDPSNVTSPISAASLPLPTGASTAAKQPALGTAGTASADVLTVQGIASMTALKVDGSAVTQPVSGTVTVDSELTLGDMDTGAGTDNRAVVGLVGAKSGGGVLIPGDATKGLAVDLTATGANTTAIKVDGSAVTQPVSGSLSLSSNVVSVQTQSSGLTIAATAYTAGDQLGAELSFANAAASAAGSFTIVSATLTDSAKVVGSADLFLFDQSGVTHAGDNTANAWSDADLLKCIGVISFPPPILSANNSIATVPVVGLAGKLSAGTTLYGVLVTRIGHTFFGAATDLAVRLLIQRD